MSKLKYYSQTCQILNEGAWTTEKYLSYGSTWFISAPIIEGQKDWLKYRAWICYIRHVNSFSLGIRVEFPDVGSLRSIKEHAPSPETITLNRIKRWAAPLIERVIDEYLLEDE